MAADPQLESCLRLADTVESAVRGLLPVSEEHPALTGLLQRCTEFRQRCARLASQAEGDRFAVAFLGPKNAGKTTLLGLLIRSREVRSLLRAGADSQSATERITWIGPAPSRPDGLPPEVHRIPADPSDFADLGAPYALVDVPGANERRAERAQAAREALQWAHVKVLVAEARQIEDSSILDYARAADGATILPVINQTRPGQGPRDFAAFLARLREAAPAASFLPHLEIPDLGLLPDADRAAAEQAASEGLRRTLREVLHNATQSALVDPQLVALRRRFRDTVRAELAAALPATSRAAADLVQREAEFGAKALEALLGADEENQALRITVRQQLRALFQERTPLLCVPWRTFAGIANLLHGALEKVPFLLVGSLPSLLTSAATAVRNLARDREFAGARESGLRHHAESLIRESLQPQLEQLEAALRSDLRSARRLPVFSEDVQVELEGLDLLQQRSTALFRRVLEQRAASRAAASLAGAAGTALFWLIFVWPVIALYRDYFSAVGQVLHWEPGLHRQFPEHGLPVLVTSLLLALVPMLILLLITMAWAASDRRARAAIRQLQAEHHGVVADLQQQGLLRIRTAQPSLRAWIDLFQSLREPAA